METLPFTHGATELKGHIARIGVPGIWTSKDTLLVFETTPKTESSTKATLRFNVDSSSLEFEGDSTFKEKFIRSSLYYDDPLANLDREELPDRILENVYLGAHYSALNVMALRERKVTHIICAGRGLSMPHPQEFKYKYIDILDWQDEDMFQHFESCMDFIDEARNQGNSVLIHCAAGVSRSSTITIAYLMKTCDYGYAEAREFVCRRRWIYPNSGFVQQLKQWEKILLEKKGTTSIQPAHVEAPSILLQES